MTIIAQLRHLGDQLHFPRGAGAALLAVANGAVLDRLMGAPEAHRRLVGGPAVLQPRRLGFGRFRPQGWNPIEEERQRFVTLDLIATGQQEEHHQSCSCQDRQRPQRCQTVTRELPHRLDIRILDERLPWNDHCAPMA
jgi:hypothetical protein